MHRIFSSIPVLLLLSLAMLTMSISGQSDGKGIEKWKKAYQSGDFGTAVKLLKKRIKKDKKNALLWNFLGLSYTRTGKGNEAIKSFEKAVKYDRDNPEYLSNLGILYSQSYLYLGKAEQTLDKAISNGSKDPNTYYYRALMVKNSDYERRAQLFDKAVLYRSKVDEAYFRSSKFAVMEFLKDLRASRITDESLKNLRKAITTIELCEARCRNKTKMAKRKQRIEQLLRFHESQQLGQQLSQQSTSECTGVEILMPARPSTMGTPNEKRVSGTIKISTRLEANGAVTVVTVHNKLGGDIDSIVLNSVNEMEFIPEICGGVPKAVDKTLVFNFKNN